MKKSHDLFMKNMGKILHNIASRAALQKQEKIHQWNSQIHSGKVSKLSLKKILPFLQLEKFCLSF